MKIFSLLLCLLNISLLQAAPKAFDKPLSARTSSYDMVLYLDTAAKQIRAEQILTFTNPSADTIWTMPFHMYYNAFKNNKSTFMTGAGRIPRNKPIDDVLACDWGWIELNSVRDAKGNELDVVYIQPDDDNTNDHSVAQVQLKTPVLPYQKYVLQMKWQSKIPKLMIRTGYSKNFYFMAQWYPKLGVYEPAGTRFATKGQWNCHQYHSATEYYGEFGVYKITMHVPKTYQVGASGFLLNRVNEGDMVAHTYLAEDVIDFTWTACPDFIELVETWHNIELKLLIMPEHVCNKERFLQATKNTLQFYENYLEPYPYPSLTIVSPPYYGLMAGAMEYPTLITAPTLCALPKGIKTTETLTIHELTHQYFMQMLATNEQEEPWMDEGFTAFFEAKILDRYYPEGTISWPYMGLRIGSEELRRGRFLNADNIKVNPMSDFGWHFKHGSYSEIVYGKGAVFLRTLEGLVGEKTMQKIMQTYFKRWKFKHPGRQNFIDVVNEIVPKEHGNGFGKDVNRLLEQAILGTETCDYAVHAIETHQVPNKLGFFESTNNCKSDTTKSEIYHSKVIVFRLGELVVPQEVLITFDNGQTKLEKWDGKARSTEFVYNEPQRVISAHLDPMQKISLDTNLINNSYAVHPNKVGIWRYVSAFVMWLQTCMLALSTLV